MGRETQSLQVGIRSISRPTDCISGKLKPVRLGKRIYRVGLSSVRLETAPTGPGENIELPNYFLKPHTDCGTKDHFYEINF